MSVGGYQGVRARSGLRAAVNARLEEISFRAGLIAASIAFVAISAIAAVAVYEFTLSHGAPAASASGAVSARSAPVTARTTPASAPPRAQGHRKAGPKPTKAQATKAPPTTRQPVTAGTTIPQPAAGQPQSQAGSPDDSPPPARSRGFGQPSLDQHGPWYGGREGWHGGPGILRPRGWGWRF